VSRRRSGPPPQPTALKILRGNPGKRRLPREEPKPAPAGAAAPSDLSTPARALWDEHAPELARLHLLTILDRRALATACRLQAVGEAFLQDAERSLEVASRRKKTAGARARRPSPALWAALKCLEKAHALWYRFGITPSERTRLQSPTPKEAPDRHDNQPPTDPLDQLAARQRARQAPAG
jgi:P27 family predicted phage terminase small subunit